MENCYHCILRPLADLVEGRSGVSHATRHAEVKTDLRQLQQSYLCATGRDFFTKVSQKCHCDRGSAPDPLGELYSILLKSDSTRVVR